MALLAGCRDDTDSLYPEPSDYESMEFNAMDDAPAKGRPITTLTIREFKVTAYTQASPGSSMTVPVMENVIVTRSGLNKWTYSPGVDWPENPVNFSPSRLHQCR